MYRISGRQFDWQRGYFNIPSFYRSAFIYGQGYCAEYMGATYGTSLAEMSLVGFAIHTATSEYPALAPDISVEAVGLTVESLQRVLALISRPIDELRTLATEQRTAWQITAYRPSVLRRFPCVSFHGGKRFLCPLPDLIIERVTSGVFYDVIDGGGEIRHEYGRRFEEYVFLYMQGQLPKMGAKREWSYRFQQQNIDTPDIVVLNDDYLVAAIECKASRMSFAARFSEEAVMERGYDDIVKGIFQIWRFFSHCRRGITGVAMTEETVGMLLTLDSWLVMGGPVTKEILQRAHAFADRKDASILPEDRRAILFCPITDFESVLADADEVSFRQALKTATQPEYDGWMLSSVHDTLGKKQPRKPYPFDDMASLLPWWGVIEEKKRQKARGG